MDEIPASAAAEVAEHFRGLLDQQRHGGNASGQRALSAILAAMPQPAPGHAEPGIGSGGAKAAPPQPPLAFPSGDVAAIDLSHKIRAAAAEDVPTPPSPQVEPGVAIEEVAEAAPPDRQIRLHRPSDTPSGSFEATPTFESTDAIHQHLLGLDPKQLCQALGRVQTKTAMLALCGLPNEVTEAALAVLPRSHSKQVRQQMNSIGSLSLRDIDDAKERVARASVVSDATDELSAAA